MAELATMLGLVRTYIESQVEQENIIIRNHRKVTAEIDTRRKHQEKTRREKELAFRQECISQGILPNSHNVFAEGTKRKYEYIGKFYDDLHKEKVEEESLFELEKKAQHDDLTRELRSVRWSELSLVAACRGARALIMDIFMPECDCRSSSESCQWARIAFTTGTGSSSMTAARASMSRRTTRGSSSFAAHRSNWMR